MKQNGIGISLATSLNAPEFFSFSFFWLVMLRKAMVAYTKPHQWKIEESERLEEMRERTNQVY